jgi:hypothetical protein
VCETLARSTLLGAKGCIALEMLWQQCSQSRADNRYSTAVADKVLLLSRPYAAANA